MENGKAKQLLDRIQDIVGDGQNVPFAAGKVLVNKEEVLEIVEELKTTIDLDPGSGLQSQARSLWTARSRALASRTGRRSERPTRYMRHLSFIQMRC